MSAPKDKLVFPIGTPLDAMWESLGMGESGRTALDLPVGTPVDTVNEIVAELFPNRTSTMCDMTTNTVVAIAALGRVHPDSVRKIASLLCRHYKERVHPYVTITSMAQVRSTRGEK